MSILIETAVYKQTLTKGETTWKSWNDGFGKNKQKEQFRL
jgi:hypothetical protein